MNHATLTIGDQTSVASRITSNNSSIRAEKMLDVLAFNNTAGVLYLLFFDGLSTLPANGTKATFGFNVNPLSGGTLGRSVDCDGGLWAWSSTPLTITTPGASGSIVIILKG